MKRIILTASLALFSVAAQADEWRELNVSFDYAARQYAFIRTTAENCQLPDEDWLYFRSKILATFVTELPRFDILAAERELDKKYSSEKRMIGDFCDGSSVRLNEVSVKGIDNTIKGLREALSKLRKIHG